MEKTISLRLMGHKALHIKKLATKDARALGQTVFGETLIFSIAAG
jgi:hypothetical protein